MGYERFIWRVYNNADWRHKLPFAHLFDRLVRVANVVKAYVLPTPAYRIRHWRIAVANVCNAACVFCTYPLAKLKHKVMPNSVLVRALKLFKDVETDVIDLTPAIGDPLFDFRLHEKVKIVNDAGYLAQFTTNGILLDKHLDWLLNPAFALGHIHVSIPSFTAADYPAQFGIDSRKGAMALDGLYNLVRRNEAIGQPLQITIAVRNRGPAREIKRSFGYRVFKPMIWGKVRVHFTPIWDNWSDAVDFSGWSDYMRRRLRWAPQLNLPCVNLRTALVNPDGTVRLCGCRVVGTDHDDMIIGTVDCNHDDLMAKATKIRDGFNEGKRPKVCVGCSFYNPE